MEEISWNDFERIEIRAGTILEALHFPQAKKPAYRLRIDFGPLGHKWTSAQITAHYELTALVGRQVIAVINFPVKQIANFFSECLVLGAYDENREVILLQTERTVPNGARIG